MCCLSKNPFGDATHRFLAVVTVSKRGKAYITFTTRSKTYTRRTNHGSAKEHLLEEFPTVGTIRRLYPKVRSIFATEHLESQLGKTFTHNFCVRHIIVDGFFYLFLSFRCINSFSSTLTDITRSIEFCTLTTVPKAVEFYALSVKGSCSQVFRYYGITAS